MKKVFLEGSDRNIAALLRSLPKGIRVLEGDGQVPISKEKKKKKKKEKYRPAIGDWDDYF